MYVHIVVVNTEVLDCIFCHLVCVHLFLLGGNRKLIIVGFRAVNKQTYLGVDRGFVNMQR